MTNADYLAIVFNSPYGIRYSKGNISSKGGSAGNFNLGRIRFFSVPFPTLKETIEIVKKVYESEALLANLVIQSAKPQNEANLLMQAVLKELFGG